MKQERYTTIKKYEASFGKLRTDHCFYCFDADSAMRQAIRRSASQRKQKCSNSSAQSGYQGQAVQKEPPACSITHKQVLASSSENFQQQFDLETRTLCGLIEAPPEIKRTLRFIMAGIPSDVCKV